MDAVFLRPDAQGAAASGAVSATAEPTVSVLIPLYNSAATIERAVSSALNQTLADIEIIVADDASADDGAARVENMARGDARIRLIRLAENRGKPHAMNVMIAQARGQWLAVLDADDAYHPGRLALLANRAQAEGADMAADNLRYIDSGVRDGSGAFGQFVRLGFEPQLGDRMLGKADLLRDTSSYKAFDYGILKPVIRRSFVERHGLVYDETSRLAEDFTYLLSYFVAGGMLLLCAQPLYDWTMPFGAVSRQWTHTGAGPWRYDYRQAITANRQLIARMSQRGERGVVAMLRRRGRQYQVMVHYINAQRDAASGRRLAAAWGIARHPGTWALLTTRIAGRLRARWP